MEIVTDLSRIEDELKKCRHHHVLLWLYNASLGRLALKITSEKSNKTRILVGVSSSRIKSPFEWKNCDFSIQTKFDLEHEEEITILTDKTAGFELMTSSGCVMAIGDASKLEDSFESILHQ